MGLIISRFKKKKSTKELLEQIQKDVEYIEEYRSNTQQRQKRLVGYLVLYSITVYLTAAILCYFYYFPNNLRDQLLYAMQFIFFPFLVYIIKRILTWYYSRKISKNEEKLKTLSERKEKILEDVMETETYKVAKEILEKYAPDQLRKNQMQNRTVIVGVTSPVSSLQSGDVRRRAVSSKTTAATATPTSQPPQPRMMGVRPQGLPPHSPLFTPRPMMTPQPTPARPVGLLRSPSTMGSPPPSGPLLSRPPLFPSSAQVSSSSSSFLPTPMPRATGGDVLRGEGGPPGPPMPRPVLPRERGYLDRFIEYLVGDGPANRFALVCRQCESHNGMALKDEFQYLAFRCAYCYYWNPARKQRPSAPRLEDLTPQLPPPLPTTQDQEEEEDEEEDQESSSEEEEEEGGAESESNSSGEEEEEGPVSSELSSAKATSSQEGSLEDLAKSTPSSDLTTTTTTTTTSTTTDDPDPATTAGDAALTTSLTTSSSFSSTTPPSSTHETEEME